MKLCADFAGDTEQKIQMLKRLGLWGSGISVDPGWTLEQAAAMVRPYHDAGLRVVQTNFRRNLISVDGAARRNAILDVRKVLEMDGKIGIPVTICGGGHRHPTDTSPNAGVHRDNWSDLAIDVLIESCREVVSLLSENASTLCLEPWVISALDSPERVEKVVRAVDHPKLAVEFDPVNMMTIERYADTTAFLEDCFERFGDKIKLVHAKDTLLRPRPFSYHMSEVIPGEGNLDYRTLLRLMKMLPDDTPLLIEHLAEEAEIKQAVTHIRGVAAELGLDT